MQFGVVRVAVLPPECSISCNLCRLHILFHSWCLSVSASLSLHLSVYLSLSLCLSLSVFFFPSLLLTPYSPLMDSTIHSVHVTKHRLLLAPQFLVQSVVSILWSEWWASNAFRQQSLEGWCTSLFSVHVWLVAWWLGVTVVACLVMIAIICLSLQASYAASIIGYLTGRYDQI